MGLGALEYRDGDSFYLYVLAAYVAPLLGVLFGNLLYLSSYKKVRQARVLRLLGNLDHTALTVQFTNTLTQTAYAVVTCDHFLFWANFLRVLLASYYVVTILELAVANGRMEIRGKVELIYMGSAFLVMCHLYVGGMLMQDTDYETKRLMAGVIANVTNALMYIAPTLNMAKVLRDKSAATLHPPYVAASLGNSIVWLCYGYLAIHDVWVYGTHIIGVIASLAQLAAILAFYRSDHPKREHLERFEKVEELKVAAIDQEYAARGAQKAKASSLLPMDYDSGWLEERIQLRNDLVDPVRVLDTHETTVTSLLGVPIPTEMTEAVLANVATETNKVQVVVDPTVLANKSVVEGAVKDLGDVEMGLRESNRCPPTEIINMGLDATLEGTAATTGRARSMSTGGSSAPSVASKASSSVYGQILSTLVEKMELLKGSQPLKPLTMDLKLHHEDDDDFLSDGSRRACSPILDLESSTGSTGPLLRAMRDNTGGGGSSGRRTPTPAINIRDSPAPEAALALSFDPSKHCFLLERNQASDQ
uniref:Bidirectional sugar transporter SWEET n=1 Tax=Eutreptiella gymnastica TaxID=73025 RepID=A0A7S1HXI4_9EUGL|mmetsp:Transcript_112974/g.196116  ORF Transcript_112974/g.196116 Transcript_112974/m.196116 type:complete len:533 (+) Transcript_112974:53-1651(+)